MWASRSRRLLRSGLRVHRQHVLRTDALTFTRTFTLAAMRRHRVPDNQYLR